MVRIKLFLPLIIFIVLAGFLWVSLGKDPRDLPSVLVDKPLPTFELPNLLESGKNVKSGDLIGQPFLLNVWATWCFACLQEHPFLLKLSQQGVKIVGVDYKDEPEKGRGWLEKYHNPYSIVISDEAGRLGLDLGVYGAPETFVVGSDGRIKLRHAGVVTEEIWRLQIEPLMK